MRSLRLVGEKTSLTDNNFPDNNDVLLLGAHKIKKQGHIAFCLLQEISWKNLDVGVIVQLDWSLKFFFT